MELFQTLLGQISATENLVSHGRFDELMLRVFTIGHQFALADWQDLESVDVRFGFLLPHYLLGLIVAVMVFQPIQF